MIRLLSRNKSIGFAVLILIIMSILNLFVPTNWTRILTKILIMVLFATSLNIQVGYGGMTALGHATFLGLGAYSFGLLFLKAGIPIYLAFIAALFLSIIISTVLGYISLRGGPMAFALLNLAFNLWLSTLITKWISLTGGDSGLVGLQRPSFFSEPQSYFYFVLIVVVICLISIWIIINSPFGKVVQGLRENEERLRFLGINVRRFQLAVFIVSTFFAAVAGILLAMADKGVFPGYASITLSVEVMMMCIIGGMTSFLGPGVGAIIVVIIENTVSTFIAEWQGLLGIVIIACVIGFRGGIMGRVRDKVKLSPEKLSSEEIAK